MTAVERVARMLAGIQLSEPHQGYIVDERSLIAALTEQGIPVDKLLSGEMVPVDARWCARAQLKMGGHALTLTDCRGTTEGPVEPTGATDSEKWPTTWPIDRD